MPEEPDQPPAVYQLDGITYYRASSLLQCPRAMIFARQGHEKKVPLNLQSAFNDGIRLEPEIISMLHHRQHIVVRSQEEVILWSGDTTAIIGHIDGLIDQRVLEIKALSHSNTEKFLSNYEKHFPYYAYQISIYMHALQLRGVFAIYDKDEKQLHLHNVLEPPITLSEIYQLIASNESAYHAYQQADILPACTTTTFCPYYYLHEDYKDDRPDIPDQTYDLLVAFEAAHRRTQLLASIEQRAREALEVALEGVREGSRGGYSFTYTPVTTTRLNQKKITTYLGDKLPEFQTTTTSKRLVVKRDTDA